MSALLSFSLFACAHPGLIAPQDRAGLDSLFDKYRARLTRAPFQNSLNEQSLLKYPAFKERIQEYFTGRANFGGHYEILSWGCGTSCRTGVIVNLLDGKILTTLPTCEWGMEFRRDSYLFIENPPDLNGTEETTERPDWAGSLYHFWTGDTFKIIEVRARQ